MRSEQRATIRDQWQVGQPYVDAAVYGIRIKERGVARRLRASDSAAARRTWCSAPTPPSCAACAGTPPATGPPRCWSAPGCWRRWWPGLRERPWCWPGECWWALAAAYARVRSHLRHGEELLHGAEEAPSVIRIASAVADGLLAAGLVRRGADSVEVALDADGEYRCVLHDVDEVEAEVFATALDEAVSPINLPRYLLPRWVRTKRDITWWRSLWAGFGRLKPDGVVWHAVPTVLGLNAERAAAYAKAWDHWVGGGAPVYTGSPEGQGILAAQQATDPFAASTVMRRQWA